MIFNERVLKHEFQLNDTDDEIIKFIKTHRSQLNEYSIQRIADDLYTVPNAIMRLCKKLGYKGFAELKALIKQEEDEDNLNTNLIPKNVSKSIELINYRSLENVANKFKHGKTCHFIGVGDSLYYCEMMAKNLRCLDKSAEYYQNYHDIAYRSEHCDDNDALVFISASGENQRLNEVANNAKSRGVSIITITHFNENSLSKLADIPLYFFGEDRKVNGYNVTDRSGLMILLREISEVFWRIYCV